MILQSIHEIAETLQRPSLWGTLGWADIKFRYRRTTFGPFWLTLSTGIMVIAIGLFYAQLLRKDVTSYIPSLAVGMVVWTFFSTSVIDGCSVFIKASNLIKAYTISLSTHVFRLLWQNVIILLHNATIIVVVWLAFRWELSWIVFLSVIGLAILLVCIFGLLLLFGILCTRFRDIPQIVAATMQLLFFLTPVMWSPADVGDHTWIIEINPLASLIEVVRAPLLNQLPSAQEWLVAAGSSALSLTCGLAFYARHSHRIAYWL